MKVKSEEIELAGFFLREMEPDIYFIVCKNVVMTKDYYEELFNAIIRLSGNKKVGLIVDLRSIKMVTYDGGQYARKAFTECLWGAAMVAQTSIARMVVNFFMSVMKPDFPMKAFNDFNSAKKWLIQLKNEQKNN